MTTGQLIETRTEGRDAYAGVLRFYELAKRQEWQVRDLPWGELPPIPEGRGSAQRRARRRDMWRSVLTQQLQADMLACEMSSQLLNIAPDPEAKLYYSTMVQDESRHTEAWLKLASEAGGTTERDPHLETLAHQVLEADMLELLRELNDDDEVDGILPQLPMPGIDEARIIRAVDPVKDVDGFHPLNAGQLYLGRPTLVPATPSGILALLDEYSIPLDGARAVVVGRSDIVGKPVAHLLLQRNATVTICHSHTDDLARQTLDADVLVVATGIAGLVGPDMVKQGAAVVDVGQNQTKAGVVGDVDPGVAERAAFLTPVPGGVGPMTIACMLANTVKAARARRGLVSSPG